MYNTIYYDAKGSTSNADRFVENLHVTNITSVTAEKIGIPCTVRLTFTNGLIVEIHDGYNIGYSGTGPDSLHDLLISAGFTIDDANRVYENDITSIYLTK